MTRPPKTIKAKNLKPLKEPSPYEAARFDDIHAHGLQAMRKGEASPAQQIAVLEWIINHASRAHKPAYRPESARDTDFALGKAFVGQQIIGILALPLVHFDIDKTPPKPPEPNKGDAQ